MMRIGVLLCHICMFACITLKYTIVNVCTFISLTGKRKKVTYIFFVELQIALLSQEQSKVDLDKGRDGMNARNKCVM